MDLLRPCEEGGCLLDVRVVPGAKASAITGTITLPDGRTALRIRIAQPPEDGRANAALCRLLAAELGLPVAAVTLRSGATDRTKRLHLKAQADALLDRLLQIAQPPRT